MFEVDQYDPRLHAAPPVRPEVPYSPHDDVEKVSLLVWGEHCVECAAPSCYQTCDLYEARPDKRCRRFLFGIFKNRNFPSLRGYGAEVSFKKWGVLATAGNTSMVPRSLLVWEERFIALTTRVLNAVGPTISRIIKDDRWIYPAFGLSRRFCTWLHGRSSGGSKPDAFLLEVYNPGPEVRMQLAMTYSPDARQELTTLVQVMPRFITTLHFPPGYSRHEFESRLFRSVTDSGLGFGISLTPEADTLAKLIFLSADFITYRNKKTSQTTRPAVKCVVWDLDNTLWDGTLVEDDAVRVKENVKQLVKTLDQRGVLLSIASKNNHEVAWQRLEALGIAEYFLVPQINWSPKSESIRTIAKRLNIGLDTLAFVDDNPFEINEVGTAIPEVTCIDVRNVDEVLRGDRFQGSETADAQSRRKYYQEAIHREEKQSEFGEDYLRFLAYCEIHLEVLRYREEDFDRVAELVQRTNQLNFSGHKYERAQLREILDDPSVEKYCLHCSDKFGSYGLIGFGLVRQSGDEIEISDLMLSCRVQGKLIEQAFFTHLQSHHNPSHAVRLRVNAKQTKRNQPALQSLEAAHFSKLEADAGYVRNINPGAPSDSDIVRVTCSAGCDGAATANSRREVDPAHGLKLTQR